MKLKFPLRYYSFTTVPKEFTPKSSLPDGGFIELGEILAGISSAPAEVSALTPYLFVLFETENGAASWQYLDLAGRNKKNTFHKRRKLRHMRKSNIRKWSLHVQTGRSLPETIKKMNIKTAEIIYFCSFLFT